MDEILSARLSSFLLFMCLFIFPNITLAQRLILNGQMAQRLGIVASEKPDIGQAIIYVHRSGDDPGLICKPIMRSKRSELCSVDFMGQLVQSVSIEVQAPGYKRWTRECYNNLAKRNECI